MGRSPGRANLSDSDHIRLLVFLAARSTDVGELKYGAEKAASEAFGCHRNTVRTVWEAREQFERCDEEREVRSEALGRSSKYTDDEVMECIAAIPVHKRTTVRATAAAAEIPATTVQRYIGKGKALRRATVSVKPALKPEQKLARLLFALPFVERPIGLRQRYFHDMGDVVHVDEKWFYIHKVSSSYILARDEQPPHLACSSKRFIAKIMFLAAVARPLYDYERKCGFDGKIGIFPIIQERAAERTTKRQKKGDTIVVPLAVDKVIFSDLLKTRMIPAIKAFCPGMRSRTVYIQQDNASPHVLVEAVAAEASTDGWDIQVRRQSAMSPDMNVLDLGFFNAIQAVQHRKQAYSIAALIEVVQAAFEEMHVDTLEKCFLTLQAVMEQVMLSGGSNDYDLTRHSSAAQYGGSINHGRRAPPAHAQASLRPRREHTYNDVTFTVPVTIQSTAFYPSITLEYEDTWFSCNNSTDLGCKEKCSTRTSLSTGKDSPYVCVVTTNATLVGTDDAVLVKDFKAGFAQGRYLNGMREDDVNSLGTDGVLSLGTDSYMPDWKLTSRNGILGVVDLFSLSLASGDAFLMFNGVDDALITKNNWTPITLPLVEKRSWQLGMTAFQVDGLADDSTALFPCTPASKWEKEVSTCGGHLTLGLTYITMPQWIYEVFEDKYLAKSTGCKKSLRIDQDLSGEVRIYVCPSDTALPRLAFTLGNATFFLDAKDYVTPKEDEADKVVVELLGGFSLDLWKLGAAFVQKFYMSYRERANITVYCHLGEHCALNIVANSGPPKDALHNRAREYFGMNTTSSASGSGSSIKKKSSTSENDALIPPSPKTRNTIAIIAVVLALLIMAASAFYRHRKRKQLAAKMAVSDSNGVISIPVASFPATATAGAAPY